MGKLEQIVRLTEKKTDLEKAIEEVEAWPDDFPNKAAKLFDLREQLAKIEKELEWLFSL